MIELRMTKRQTCVTCWIPNATVTHSEYVVLLAFPLQQWFCKHASHIAHLVAIVHANAWNQNLYWLLTLSIGGIMTDGGNQSYQSNYKCT
jgi:hypothetical protein